MRQGNASKAEHLVGAGAHVIAHAVRSADYKGDVAVTTQHKIIEPRRKLLARALFALNGQQDHMRPRRQCSKNCRPLLVTCGIHTARLGRVDIGHLADIDLGIGTQALGVLSARVLPKALLELTDANDGVFHARLLLRIVLNFAGGQHLFEH